MNEWCHLACNLFSAGVGCRLLRFNGVKMAAQFRGHDRFGHLPVTAIVRLDSPDHEQGHHHSVARASEILSATWKRGIKAKANEHNDQNKKRPVLHFSPNHPCGPDVCDQDQEAIDFQPDLHSSLRATFGCCCDRGKTFCDYRGGTVTILTLAQTNITRATVITQTLGHMAFPDGTKVAIVPFAAAHVGDPFPFDGTFNGSDPSGPNFSESWMFSYGCAFEYHGCDIGPRDLRFRFGTPGNQVASFILNGSIDLTSPLNVAFEANPSPNSYVNDYSITLDSSTFSELATGTATFALTLQGPGLGVLGTTPFNGAASTFQRSR